MTNLNLSNNEIQGSFDDPVFNPRKVVRTNDEEEKEAAAESPSKKKAKEPAVEEPKLLDEE